MGVYFCRRPDIGVRKTTGSEHFLLCKKHAERQVRHGQNNLAVSIHLRSASGGQFTKLISLSYLQKRQTPALLMLTCMRVI